MPSCRVRAGSAAAFARRGSILCIATATAALLSGGPGVGCSEGTSDANARLRIVLITVDTLRYDSFEKSGSDGSSDMPRIRAFAAGGQVFENFYASSSATQPTHASLFTGLHPWQHGLFRNGMVLPAAATTLAELLSAEGFATAAVVASFPLERRFGFDQGFDEYFDEFTESIGETKEWGSLEVENSRFYTLANKVTGQALRLIRRTRAPKQFFWFHYFDPHDPYGDTSGRAIRAREIRSLHDRGGAGLREKVSEARRLYDRDVARLDLSLHRLLGELAKDSGRTETHIVFTSDHGESFGERAIFGHGTLVSREQVQVPFFIVSPKLSLATRTDFAGSVDVLATILSLAGLEPPVTVGRDLGAPPPSSSDAAFGMVGNVGDVRDKRTGRVKLDDPQFFAAGRDGLYGGTARRVVDEDDPDRPLERGRVRRLRRQFRGFKESLIRTTAPDLVDEKTRRALRALGYAR